MDKERSATITLAGEDYEMILTTRATKEIGLRYGGLSDLGEKLTKNENFETILGEIVWLITLLINQGILIHNLKNKANPKDLLNESDVELLTSPLELSNYKDAIMKAMYKGTMRNVESEEETSKNVLVE